MKFKFVGVAALLWVFAGTMVFLKPNRNVDKTLRSPSSIPEAIKKPELKKEKKDSPSNNGAEPLKKTEKVQFAKAPPVEFTSPEIRSSFQSFQLVQKKVLPRAEDKRQKADLIANKQMIQLAQELLSKAAQAAEDQVLQNQAIDYLFEALKGPHSAEAITALKAIVADKTIENQKVHMSERKALAGVKAEVLYQLSSERPAEVAGLQASLPGPVSQRIWLNVQSQQENNLAESRQIKDQRP